MTDLSRTYVRRIIGDAALKANIHADCVIYLTRGEGARVAKATMRRILSETGCSPSDLAKAWGCEPSTVYLARREPESAPQTPRVPPNASKREAQEHLLERLRWRYGNARAAQIIAGNCPKTNQDIAAWKRLGHGRGS